MDPLGELIGQSPAIQTIRAQIERLLGHQSLSHRLPPILIEGETGTGKGLLAHAIHRAGPRAGGPFVDVNCAAIPDTMLETEMFGFERGAFTDARQAKQGLFQAAHHGTIFLDEIGHLPEGLQTKLLKVIEERQVRRLGSTRSEPVDVWIITATSEPLQAAVHEGRFHDALYHRLSVLMLTCPPLRERGRDILLLAEHFLTDVCRDYRLPRRSLAPDARAALLAYRWPGNVRELGNLIERVALLCEAPVLTADLLGLPLAAHTGERASRVARGTASLANAVESVERRHLLDALGRTDWNVTRAASELGISRDTLRYRIEKYDLRPSASGARASRRAARTASPPRIVAPGPGTPPPTAARWERRRVSFLRAVLPAPRQDGAVVDASRHLERVIDKVKSFGGRVEELSPTGIVGAFGLEPVEDAPRRAAHAAMAILKAAGRVGIAVSVGLHVREVLVFQSPGATEVELEGKRQAWAALESLLERAEPGAILVTSPAASFLERRFDLLPVASAGSAVGAAYRLAERERSGLSVGTRMAPFVGRRHDLETLQTRLASAVRGTPQVVGIVGDAGIGKSRLIFEFKQGLAERRLACLEGRCLSYGNAVPYLPVLDILRQDCGIGETDSAEVLTEKVAARLREVGVAATNLPYLLHLLGAADLGESLRVLTPEAIQSRTFEILRRMTVKRSEERPLVLIVEDLHWIDKASEAYLTSLVDTLVNRAALLIFTHRPGYRPPWIEKSFATQLALQALEPEDSLSIVQSVVQKDGLPDDLARLILAKAEGNPFFLEELARAVEEERAGDAAATVPDTIQEVLLARINRLADQPKRLLQMAAVLGRDVALRLLEAIWDGENGPSAQLRELTRLEFLYERRDAEEDVYHFKHALTQEVAYDSLPGSRRQALHAAAGKALEALVADRVDKPFDRLAYHFSNANETEKAVEYLTLFAEKAFRSNAHVEALTALQEALAHAERLPIGERDHRVLDLILRQVRSFSFLGGNQKSLDVLLAQQERLDRLHDPRKAGAYFFTLGLTSSLLGDQERAARSAHRALEEAKRCGDEATMGKAYALLALEGVWSGQPRQGIEYGHEAVVLLERTQQRYWLGQTHLYLAFNHYLIGDVKPALESAARAKAIGEAIGHTGTQSYAAWTSGGIHALAGDWQAGIEACQRGLDLSPDPLTTAQALGFLGYAHLEKGDPASAIPLLEQSIELIRLFRFRQEQGWFTALLGEAHLMSGNAEKARDLATQGLQITQEANYRYGVAVAQRILGRIAYADGSVPDAFRLLGEALETFSAIPAGFETARTHLALAELAHAERHRDDAAAHLRDARGLFRTLGVPIYVERTEQLAMKLDVRL